MATIPASENEFPEVLFSEGAAPAAPGTGLVKAYAKSDGLLYSKDDAGAETALGPTAHIADTTDAHDASAVSVDPTGLSVVVGTDVQTAIEELDAGISGGGIPVTIIDAKGDLIAGSAADTAVRRAVGTDGQSLVADSGQASGLNWQDKLNDHTHAATGNGATGGGATLNVPTIQSTGLFRWNSGITSSVNADQNDFNPASLHTSTIVYFDSFSANRTITGLDAGSNGEVKIFINNTGFSCILSSESASSSANNRFRTPNLASHTIRQRGSAIMVYWAGRWNVIAA